MINKLKQMVIFLLVFVLSCQTVGVMDRNLVFYNLSKKAMVSLISSSMTQGAFTNGDRVLLVNISSGAEKEKVNVDLIAPDGSIIGETSISPNLLRTIEDGFVNSFCLWAKEKNIYLVEKINLYKPRVKPTTGESVTEPIFYLNPLTIDDVNALISHHKITKIIVYRIVAYRTPSIDTTGNLVPARLKLFYRVFKTDTGVILASDIIDVVQETETK